MHEWYNEDAFSKTPSFRILYSCHKNFIDDIYTAYTDKIHFKRLFLNYLTILTISISYFSQLFKNIQIWNCPKNTPRNLIIIILAVLKVVVGNL